MKLGDYITPLISPSFHWITFLSLSNLTCVRVTGIHISYLGPVLDLDSGHGASTLWAMLMSQYILSKGHY